MITFIHAGKMGDILYSLYFCKEFSDLLHFDKFNYVLEINKKPSDFCSVVPGGNMLSLQDAEFIRPLLERQPYIREVTICESPEKKGKTVDLNIFRRGAINQYGCEIRDWYYSFCSHTLPCEFWKQLIHVEPNPKYKDTILFTLSERYVNIGIDYSSLKQFRDHMAFIGTASEYQAFQKKYFELERVELKPEDTLLTVAQYLAGAKGYLANATGFFALAELLKINRILLSSDWITDDLGRNMPGPKTVLPLGGWHNSASITQKMVAATKELIEL